MILEGTHSMRNGTRNLSQEKNPMMIGSWNNSQDMLHPCSLKLKRKRSYPMMSPLTGFDDIEVTKNNEEKNLYYLGKGTQVSCFQQQCNKKREKVGCHKSNRIKSSFTKRHHQVGDDAVCKSLSSYDDSRDNSIIINSSRRLYCYSAINMDKRKSINLRFRTWMGKCILLTILFKACDVRAKLPRSLQSVPTVRPTISTAPSLNPSRRPSLTPTKKPTASPTRIPTNNPTKNPSGKPSLRPTVNASEQPSLSPSVNPSARSSERPSSFLSNIPSLEPTRIPSSTPSLRPTSVPTSKPTVANSSEPSTSQTPSSIPSISPTSQPTKNPSISPSSDPTTFPSTSGIPSVSPTISAKPSLKPTQTPSLTGSFQPSSMPTSIPTFQPSLSSKPSISPSSQPSLKPSISMAPSTVPSSRPTIHPSRQPSFEPSHMPSNSPSTSMQPSLSPTLSAMPSHTPSSIPSEEPTNFALSTAQGTFYQSFTSISNINASQSDSFEELIENYTELLTVNGTTKTDRINTTCSMQFITFIGITKQLNLRYEVNIESIHSNVTSFESYLLDYINSNLLTMGDDLRNIGINVSDAGTAYLLELTDPPTVSPTVMPSKLPSAPPSSKPTGGPSFQPSDIPTILPTQNPSYRPSDHPSAMPSIFPTSNPSSYPSYTPSTIPTIIPTVSPTFSPTDTPTANIGPSTTIIASVVSAAAIGGMALILTAGLCLRRRWYKTNEDERMVIVNGEGDEYDRPSRTNGILGGGLRAPLGVRNRNRTQQQPPLDQNVNANNNQTLDNLGLPVLPRADSMISHESIISTGSSVDGASVNDFNDIQVLDDEFEKYKDQNLENMRSKLEGIVTNFDGMMCQALTMALMEEDDEVSESESLAVGEKDSIQIEADLLCEMNDWLKRTEGASVDDR